MVLIVTMGKTTIKLISHLTAKTENIEMGFGFNSFKSLRVKA